MIWRREGQGFRAAPSYDALRVQNKDKAEAVRLCPALPAELWGMPSSCGEVALIALRLLPTTGAVD